MKGRVAALAGPERVEVRSFDVPEPEPGAVVARVRRANVCGSEVHIYHFHHPLIRECGSGSACWGTSSSARSRPWARG
jgi:threonine dehydrogenase-like Zn-dependent dehydrogenase